MATKRLHSMIFPGLADSYSVPQQTTELSDFDNFVKAGLAIASNGNTHLAIPADMYVYVYNHNTLDNGLYQNISGATIPVGATLTTSNVSQVTGGGLNVLKNTLNHLEDGLAIIVNGDTCSTAVPVGGYAYIKNNTHGLAEGLYTNTSASAFPTSGGTANSSVFTAVSDGGLNTLSKKVVSFSIDATTSGSGKIQFSSLTRANVVLLPGAVDYGYNNVVLIPTYINGANWAYQVMNENVQVHNTPIKGTGFYIPL